MKRLPAVLLFIMAALDLCAQKENWDTYIMRYEDRPGSVLLNMDLRKSAPDLHFPFLFAAGVRFKACTDKGLPVPVELTRLGIISDSVLALVDRLVGNRLAGTFTFQCVRRDYFYVSDTTGLREAVTVLIKKYFAGYIPSFHIKKDESWDAYLGFLYPSDSTLEYMKNQKVISQLEKAGDKGGKSRKVDHWLYFKTETDRNCFLPYATGHHFKIEATGKSGDAGHPYALRISRPDTVELNAISRITLALRQAAGKCNGDYDGWETQVVK